MKQEADEILVRRSLAGDSEGFARLCERYYPALVATAHSVLMDGHMAEDVAQEAITEACRRLRSLRRPERFGPWLGAICRNIARDALRDLCRRRRAAGAYAVPERDCDPEESAVLAEALASLPEHLRQVVLLRYSNELTYEQMSQVLDLSEQAINGRLRRAKKRIARFMQAKGFEV
jgi:RNA polymerase sigma-70 factor (ECF subfamily)